MKFRLLLTSAAIAAAALSAAADTFYVSPEGAGEKTGADEANAMDVAAFRAHAAGLAENTNPTYIFAGGEYSFDKVVSFAQKNGPILIGNTDGERTVFNAASQNPDLSAGSREGGILYIQSTLANQLGKDPMERPVKISGIDFCNLTTNTNNNNGNYIISAIGIENSGYVEVEDCTFRNNVCTTEQGGPAIGAYRSTLVVRNCRFIDNRAGARGGAVNMRSNSGAKGYSIFENCLFQNNKVTGNKGGALFIAHGAALVLNGCTFTGNEAQGEGSVLYANGKDATYPIACYVVNSTIADNPCAEGAPLMVGNGSNVGQLSIANSIILQSAEGAVIASNGTAGVNLVSGGYNYLGTVDGATDAEWAKTGDVTGKLYADLFGANTLGADGFIKPAVFVAGATTADLNAATADWGMPACVVIGERAQDMTPGAKGYTAEDINSDGIADVAVDENAPVEYYNLQGVRVANPESGLYIRRQGGKATKVLVK